MLTILVGFSQNETIKKILTGRRAFCTFKTVPVGFFYET